MMGCPKGRSWIKPGEKCPVPKLLKTKQIVAKHARLSVADVNEMRRLRYECRYTLAKIAKAFKISVSCTQQVCAGTAWKVREK